MYSSCGFRHAVIRLLSVGALVWGAGSVSAQPASDEAPGRPGTPQLVAVDGPSLAPVAPWRGGDPEWPALDPAILPGRDASTAAQKLSMWTGGPRFRDCLVQVEYVPAPEAITSGRRLSLLVGCVLPAAPGEHLAGYEVALDADGALRIHGLAADGTFRLLGATSPGAVALTPDVPCVVTVGRAGDLLAAKVQPARAADGAWQVVIQDPTYGEGLLGVAAAGEPGRVISVVSQATTPEIPSPSQGAPGKPGQPQIR